MHAVHDFAFVCVVTFMQCNLHGLGVILNVSLSDLLQVGGVPAVQSMLPNYGGAQIAMQFASARRPQIGPRTLTLTSTTALDKEQRRSKMYSRLGSKRGCSAYAQDTSD